MLKSYLFKRVTIVGVGLMGGSLGMALRKKGLTKEVVGLSQSQKSLDAALEHKAIDAASTDISRAIRNADLIVMATPVDSIIKLFSAVRDHLKRGAIITDLGSTKVNIVEAANKLLPNAVNFVGSHPLVGSEQAGVQNASAELFEGKQCIMTPTQNTSRHAKDRVRKMWEEIGATVKVLTPEEHDQILAFTSHLPHLMAYALMEAIPEKSLDFASSGLKDTTRIASSSPQMWNDIFISNSTNLLNALDGMVDQLANMRLAIAHRDQKALMKFCSDAKAKRDSINGKIQS